MKKILTILSIVFLCVLVAQYVPRPRASRTPLSTDALVLTDTSDRGYFQTMAQIFGAGFDATIGALTASTNIIGGATIRGTGTFTTTAEVDTVLIAGALATDYYFLTPEATGADAESDDVLYCEPKADTLIVHRPAGGTSALTYNWLRMR